MDDSELLRLAAKAVGGGEIVWTDIEGNRYTGDPERPWNPLKDDGDAFSLVVTLGLKIEWAPKQQCVCAERHGVGEIVGWVDDAGRSGALRQVITMAAAKIGKLMP